MKFTEVQVDVYCTMRHAESAYRVYINDELLSERTVRWPIAKYYVEENIVATLPAGQYTVTVEPARTDGRYVARNLRINGKPVTGLTFII